MLYGHRWFVSTKCNGGPDPDTGLGVCEQEAS